MIEIHDKRDCTGCSACVQRCPVNCISFDTDSQGFLYPEVDKDRCIGCNLCEKVCPVINQGKERDDITVYAAKNRNQSIQMASSSGGVFIEIAKKIILDGGIVFGARFDENWNVVHSHTDNIEGLKAFMSSKYSQSAIGDNYLKAEQFLKQGRTVLFSGTPCQIAGLKRFLMRDWGRRLVTVDVFCHGVPSPLVWNRYLSYLRKNHGWDRISSVRFRDKSSGWNSYSVTIEGVCGNQTSETISERVPQNIYMQGFLKDLYLRPCCTACPAKSGKSESDFTLGDFWGIKKIDHRLFDNHGVSQVVTYSGTDMSLIDTEAVSLRNIRGRRALKHNPVFVKSAKPNRLSEEFWRRFPSEGIDCIVPLASGQKPSSLKKLIRRATDVKDYLLGNLESRLRD